MKLADVTARGEKQIQSWEVEVNGGACSEEDDDTLRLLSSEEVDQVRQFLRLGAYFEVKVFET